MVVLGIRKVSIGAVVGLELHGFVARPIKNPEDGGWVWPSSQAFWMERAG